MKQLIHFKNPKISKFIYNINVPHQIEKSESRENGRENVGRKTNEVITLAERVILNLLFLK